MKVLRRFWYERTIRAKLLIAIAVINLIGAGVAGTIAVLNARQATRVEIEASLEVAKRFVRATIQGLSPDGKIENLSKKINQLTSRLRLAQLRHVRISVADASGKLVSVQETGQARGNQLKRAPAWFASLVEPHVASQELSIAVATSGDSTFILERPVAAVPKIWNLGTVVIAGEPADEIAEVWHDISALALVWLMIDALILGVLFLVLGRMLDPLRNLARGMIKLEDGHYATRLEQPKVQELAAIAERFNFLAEALDRARAENAHLYGQLIMVQEEERREIANEIHDEASPCLFGITANALSVQMLTGTRSDRKTVEMRGHITEILKVTERLNLMNRMLLKKLRPVALGRVALADLIEDLCREMQRRYPNVSLAPTIKTLMASYGEQVDLTVYRCVQEGVTNAIRHGKAGSVRVEIFEKRRTRAEGKFKAGPALHLAIQDDGHGIGADTPAGFGLTVMRERIHALGGSFIIESAPTRGTTLLIILPIQNRAAEGSKPREGIQVS
jgi:two-component system sensor histidine kinase UhpB